ncbi:MAG TPA: hypothetical protein VNW06_06475 [Cytophagaceae bacterium]|nr:hypothetical protein [Cytophagaceae bacterium]
MGEDKTYNDKIKAPTAKNIKNVPFGMTEEEYDLLWLFSPDLVPGSPWYGIEPKKEEHFDSVKTGIAFTTSKNNTYWKHEWYNDEVYIWEVNSKSHYTNANKGFDYLHKKVLETVKAKTAYDNNKTPLPADYDERFLRFKSNTLKGQQEAKGTNFWFKRDPGWDNDAYNDLNPDFKDKAESNQITESYDKKDTGFYYVAWKFDPEFDTEVKKVSPQLKEFKVFQKQEDRPLEGSDGLRKENYQKKDPEHKKENDENELRNSQQYKWTGMDKEGLNQMKTYNMLQKGADKLDEIGTKDTWYDIEGIGGGGINMDRAYLIEKGIDPSKVSFVYNKEGSTGFWEASKTTKYNVYYKGELQGSVTMSLIGFASGESYIELVKYIKRNQGDKEAINAVKNAYHIRWSDTSREGDTKKNANIDIIRNSLGGSLDLATILTEGTISGAGELGKGLAQGTRYINNSVLKNYSSKDPLVGKLATSIEAEMPGSIVSLNKEILKASGGRVTDFDIETTNFVIQVKSGATSGIGKQVAATRTVTGKQVLVLSPKAGSQAIKNVQLNGGILFKSESDLILYLKKFW